MKQNERLQAVLILTSLLKKKSTLSQLMPETAEVLPMTKELCFGFCRHYLRLEAIADRLLDKRPKHIEVWVVLLLGLYQLQYMKQPDYAVVQETVALLGQIKKIWAKGLVNAVLRQFCRKRGEILAELAHDPSYSFGQPQWLLNYLQKDWPDDWQAIAAANDMHPPMTLRVNVQKYSTAEYLALLEQAGIAAYAHPHAPQALTLASPCSVYDLPGFVDACVSVQDAAAQLAVSLLALKPGLKLLDACCAPGGKTCHILESQPDLASCLALDVDSKRLRRVKENLQRLHLQAQLLEGDALTPEAWWDGTLFDRILLDAPCSATGVIRRHSDIKLLRTNEEIAAVQAIQRSMLQALWPLLAPGGLLVYATCSVIAAENEQQIAAFVQTHPDCTVHMPDVTWGRSTGHGRQILPGEDGMDGFFYSILVKN
ncbi:MAG: 16S rRNA (cytosine(967)-C(5))-methyltransferase RsmB [Legionella sp.]|jgi:16S rRNA (cytosine967-C5)-methyltransferase